jgi:hypothetical protein
MAEIDTGAVALAAVQRLNREIAEHRKADDARFVAIEAELVRLALLLARSVRERNTALAALSRQVAGIGAGGGKGKGGSGADFIDEDDDDEEAA